MTIKQLVVTCSMVLFATACGGKSGGADEPAPGSARVQINKDKKRSTPLTSGEHESTAKFAQGLGCEVKLVADGHIDVITCAFDGVGYKFIFDKPGDEKDQTIWCETAEANVANCDAVAFDKIIDPKPVAAPTAPDSAPAQ